MSYPGIDIPQPVPVARGWQLDDFLRLRRATPGAANGAAAVVLKQLDENELWLIDRAVVSCTSSTDTTLRFYDSYPDPTRFLSGSEWGNFDEADYTGGGLQVAPGAALVAVWSGCSNGAVGNLYLQGRIMRRA